MEEATSKGGLSRFSVSLSSKQTDRKSLINNDQGSNQFKNYITLLFNDIFHCNRKSFNIEEPTLYIDNSFQSIYCCVT